MAVQKDNGDASRLFHDLRLRNERRSKIARLQAKRRKQIDRVIQVTRQRRFRKTG